MTILVASFITTIIIILVLLLIIELGSGRPFLFFKHILLRNFKILLFNGLYENGENKQCYVLTGVTWFGIPITYQAHDSGLNENYVENFVIGKTNWIREGCRGFDSYKDAKEELRKVKNSYIKKKKESIWISGVIKEDEI